MRSRIRDIDELKAYLPRLARAGELKTVTARFPLAITPYYLSLIQDGDPFDPVLLMSVPRSEELDNPLGLSDDPLDEESDMPTPGLTHRYPDRALIVISEICPMYCRHCTRKRFVGVEESAISPQRLENYLDYIRRHPEIKDVIISGGDPLSLPDKIIERVLSGLRAIPTVEIIRIGSRIPVLMPQRITPEFCEMIRRYHPVWINTHFNHPNEVTPEAALACDRLLGAGVPMNNQSVLLRGINDDPEVMLRLCRALFRIRVRPYYLYQCDLSRGVEHFRTPISRGIEIMEYLRGRLGGLAIPQYIVDAPHGGGKIPVGPNYIVSVSPTHTVLRNFEGLMVSYPEPVAGPVTSPIAVWCGLPTPTWEGAGDSSERGDAAGPQDAQAAAAGDDGERGEADARDKASRGGVAALASGRLDCLVPEGSARMDRRRMIDHSRSPRFKPEEYQQKRLLAEIGEIVSKVDLSGEAPRAEGEHDPLPFPSNEDASGRHARWHGGMEAVD
jgi:lysine 2,3-aminomutase